MIFYYQKGGLKNMKPKIIMHTQISLDGRIKGFDNPEVYYQVAGGIHSDAVLFGSNTVFTAFEKYPAETEADFEKIITSPEDPRPIGVIPDSRGILRSLHCLRNLGYLKEIVILWRKGITHILCQEMIMWTMKKPFRSCMSNMGVNTCGQTVAVD
jgi:2,5-diamino-6-(ribosylamino)-4(3H)-pyrimidinone 5'-phosphate reductase